MLEISSKIEKISNAFEVEKKQVSDAQELDSLKNKFLGRKGLVSSLFKDLSEIQADKRKEVGADINSLKSYIEKSIDGMGFKKRKVSIILLIIHCLERLIHQADYIP